MKIVFFKLLMTYIGGAERIFVEKMNYLADVVGYDVFFVTVCQGQHPFLYPLSPKVKHVDMGIKVHEKYQQPIYKRPFLDYRYNKQIKGKLQELVADINPDIITTAVSKEHSVVFDIKTNAKIIMESHTAKKYTHTLRQSQSIISHLYRRWQEQKYFKTIEKKSDVIVALTNDDAKEWDAENVTVIPNFVDLHNKTNSPLTNKVALFAGRFAYQKGLDMMLEAWKSVVEKRKDWTLRLVGEGDLKEELIKQCKALGIEENVVFAEATENIIDEYCNASMFLLTSRYEGFGLVLAEAMQCGVPCISFDCPYGPADIIDSGKNGIIVENGNIEKFANAVLKLIDDEELRKNLGQAAKEKAKAYLPETIMPQWINLFNT